jgi:urease accessory protein
VEVDRELDAMKLGREGRMASRQMGRQVIRLALDPQDGLPLLAEYRRAVEMDLTPGHLAVSLGLTLAAAGWSKNDTIASFLYQTATGYVAAAMKLLPVGQREAQQLLVRWMDAIVEVAQQAAQQRVLKSWSPVQDIYAMRHSQLQSRLFRS